MDGALFEASVEVSEVDGMPGGHSFSTMDSGGQRGASMLTIAATEVLGEDKG
jgi:hypothetical protein